MSDFNFTRRGFMAGFAAACVAVIVPAKRSFADVDPLKEFGSIGWKTWHAGAILNSNWGRVIRPPEQRFIPENDVEDQI